MRARLVLLAFPAQAAVGGGADAGIVAVAPVGQVVAALAADPRVVGDLVGRQPGVGEARGGLLVERGRCLFFRPHQPAAPTGAVKDGSFLRGWLVGREDRNNGRTGENGTGGNKPGSRASIKKK